MPSDRRLEPAPPLPRARGGAAAAVGSAGVAVAQSFNGMAANAAEGGGFGYVLAAFIAVFGHTLNLMLAAMAVLVWRDRQRATS